MPTPTEVPTYTSAQFRTDRDELGVSVGYLAGRLGVADVTVWKYQASTRDEPVPDHVRALMVDLLAERDRMVYELAECAPILRPSTDDALAEHYPDLAGWGLHAFGLIAAAAQRYQIDERAERTPIQWIVEARA